MHATGNVVEESTRNQGDQMKKKSQKKQNTKKGARGDLGHYGEPPIGKIQSNAERSTEELLNPLFRTR